METLMARVENVSGTAFVVAEFRAEENAETAPLYRDSVVGLFLTEETKRAAERVAVSFPPVKDLVKIRTKYFDDTLERQLFSQFRQVVILGAGLDTRAVRKRSPGVTYFEIDEAATLNVKQACYQHHGLDVNVKFIAGNYVVDGTIDLLEQNGFDCGLPSYFIWEGNTMYLPIDGTRKVLAELRSHVKRFRVSFDYMAESVISKTTGDPGITTLVESFANMGAPWLSGIKDVKGLARDLGLDVVENFRMADLHQEYGVTRPMSSPIFNYYAVCTLGHESASRRQAA
jgi:methyltransferase (TIGR00027 family)